MPDTPADAPAASPPAEPTTPAASRPEAPTTGAGGPVPAGRAALAGSVAAAAALAAGELVASALRTPGPVYAVANRVVDRAPHAVVQLGKSLFGLADKPALVAGTTILALALGAASGAASRRSHWNGTAVIGGFGLLGLVAMGTDARGHWPVAVVSAAVAVAAGVATLRALLQRATGADLVRSAAARPARGLDPYRVGTPVDPAVSRRRFFRLAGTVGAAAAFGAYTSRQLRARSTASDARASVPFDSQLAQTDLPAEVAAAGESAVGSIRGITPLVVPNGNFYRIDTALLNPQVDPANWQLEITGMVDRKLTFTYDELQARARTVAPVTLSCVSNGVGGDLVGNAIWQGVPLVDLLNEAGVKPGATQIASRSVDGWTCGFPTAAAFDGRTALVALAMNDEPLPLAHGFPARLVVSGLYGYVSATKWLSRIELTTLEGFDGYWVPRGWSKLGPVKTQSRIDTPSTGARLAAGSSVPIAGVAWAPHTGIERVEVQVDDGPWLPAELGQQLGPDAWVQWLFRWTATPGRHSVRVRATDRSGYTQTSAQAPPAPDGATGWHTIRVEGA